MLAPNSQSVERFTARDIH